MLKSLARHKASFKESLNKYVETIKLGSLSHGERDRVRGKSVTTPLTLTLSPEIHGGEGTGSEFP
jgi:hypothetical protein